MRTWPAAAVTEAGLRAGRAQLSGRIPGDLELPERVVQGFVPGFPVWPRLGVNSVSSPVPSLANGAESSSPDHGLVSVATAPPRSPPESPP